MRRWRRRGQGKGQVGELGLIRNRMAACHPQRVSPRCDQPSPNPCGRLGARCRYLGSWIVEVEKEVADKVPEKMLKLKRPLESKIQQVRDGS
jgi:hypothetical protein